MMLKRIGGYLVIFCILGCTLTNAGCNTKKEGTARKLIVVTEASFRERVEEAADFMMNQNHNDKYKIQVDVLPEEPTHREQVIKKLQTQIMAGKGPDLYILDSSMEYERLTVENLFKDPSKIMESGVLAPLDKYIEKDSYWKNSTYKKELLDAGKYSDRQYIIPFSCDYFIFAYPTSDEQIRGSNLKEWLQQIEKTDNKELQSKMMLSLMAGRWGVPAIDYENKEILFSKDEVYDFSLSYLQLSKKRHKLPDSYKMSSTYDLADSGRSFSNDFQNKRFQFVPNLYGEKPAAVKSYGTVSMSSSYKDAAYQFLMLFLNDTIETEMKKIDKDTRIKGYIDSYGIPVQEKAIQAKAKAEGLDKTVTEQVCKTFSEIEQAFFVTDTERNMYTSIENLEFGKPKSDALMKEDVKNLVETVWEEYSIRIKE